MDRISASERLNYSFNVGARARGLDEMLHSGERIYRDLLFPEVNPYPRVTLESGVDGGESSLRELH